jgi:hypothetical protein
VTEKNSKLIQDEEEITSKAEPMGSVAAAVARDQGSSAAAMKPEAPKPAAEHTDDKPARH